MYLAVRVQFRRGTLKISSYETDFKTVYFVGGACQFKDTRGPYMSKTTISKYLKKKIRRLKAIIAVDVMNSNCLSIRILELT